MRVSTSMRRLAVFSALFFCSITMLQAQQEKSQQQKEDEVRGAPAEPDDAAEVRAQIADVEKLLAAYVDRGGALYFLADSKMHLGEPREALDLLKQCMALEEGFDPSGGPGFAGLRSERAFTEMVDR